eukprot:COSAG01_NODE_1927_length_8881_cov_51.056479_9_plen_445_part_00
MAAPRAGRDARLQALQRQTRQMISVQVPAGWRQGTPLQVQLPTGQLLPVNVPAGARPGSVFQVPAPQMPPAHNPEAWGGSASAVSVQVPAGWRQGTPLQVQLPTGQIMNVSVPAGTQPGSLFQVPVPQMPPALNPEAQGGDDSDNDSGDHSDDSDDEEDEAEDEEEEEEDEEEEEEEDEEEDLVVVSGEAASPARAGQTYQVLVQALIRTGSAMDSEECGILHAGQEVTALETRVVAGGIHRVRISLGGDWERGSTGWVSQWASDGSVVLEPTFGAVDAALARARGADNELEPPPQRTPALPLGSASPGLLTPGTVLEVRLPSGEVTYVQVLGSTPPAPPPAVLPDARPAPSAPLPHPAEEERTTANAARTGIVDEPLSAFLKAVRCEEYRDTLHDLGARVLDDLAELEESDYIEIGTPMPTVSATHITRLSTRCTPRTWSCGW